MENDLVYKIALTQIPGIGSVLAKSLIAYCGGVKPIFSKSVSFLQRAPGIGLIAAKSIKNFNDFSLAEAEVKFVIEKDIRVYFFLDDDYPIRLKNIPDCPILIYTKGEIDFSPSKCIGIVGTRKITEYGIAFMNQLFEHLQAYDVTVVSGLAYGVDVYAHKKCLEFKLPTIGVVAHGLDRLYPSLHRSVVKKMLVDGAGGLLTEFPTGTNPDRENFPKRNRIVAGLVDAIIVVESALKGGSLITADLANQYNRDVLAVPGNIGKQYSEGCNFLIKKHKAHMIESIDDLVRLLNWDVVVEREKQTRLFAELKPEEQRVMDLIEKSESIGVDELRFISKLSSSQFAMAILGLEMKNCITTLPGKRYKAI